MSIQNSLYGKDLSEVEAAALYVPINALNEPLGVPSLDEVGRVSPTCVPALTTQVGFGGEVITVPYTGNDITLPLPISQGGTGTTNPASALSALGAQASYPILNSIQTTGGSGFLIKATDNTVAIRSLQVNEPLSLTNANGVSNHPTLSLNQGEGSGLNADTVDGLHGTAFLRVDGGVTHSSGTASSIRSSIGAASSGDNTDITSLSTITNLGNTSNNHIQITSSGAVGIGDTPTPYGKVAIRGGVANTANSTLALLTPNGAINYRANLALYSTFGSGTDTNVRRTADIVAGYNAGWGTEYLSLNVGGSTDSKLVATERVRIDGSGNLLVGKTTTTANAGDVQVSRGLSFPSVQIPCSNANTLDDYEEGTWTPSIDSEVPGTGRISTVLNATYTKIGRLVIANAYVQLTTLGTGGSGYTKINGLPYAISDAYSCMSVGYFAGLKAGVIFLTGLSIPNTTSFILYGTTAASTYSIVIDFNTYIQTYSVFIVSMQYFSAS